MGCTTSIHVVNNVVNTFETPIDNNVVNTVQTPVIDESSKYIAGKFNRITIPKELWLCRMQEFITNHVQQLKHYCSHDYDIMYQKLHSYENNVRVRCHNNDKHSQAVQVLSGMFNVTPCPSPKQLREVLTTMALDYCMADKEHDFEEIAFVFSIIVNSPMIKFFETKY